MNRMSYRRITRSPSTGHRAQKRETSSQHRAPGESIKQSTIFAVPTQHLAINITRLLRRRFPPTTVLTVQRLLKAISLFVIVRTRETRAGRGAACGWESLKKGEESGETLSMGYTRC